jgi:3-hydroxyisobutyrate dehydrogenase
MKTGFIGLGNVGGKLAGSLLRNGIDLTVHDLDPSLVAAFASRGAEAGGSPVAMMRACDVVITCLPSPAASAAVVAEMLPEMGTGKIWMEMSTTDADEVLRLGADVAATGGMAVECPVSGGCHRADTGNISIFAGGPREAVEAVMPLLKHLGRRILHTGDLGTASKLKVMTNYLATVHLVALCEALTTMKAAGLDLATTYEAIRISSGTSFVHETESQLILSGSRDVNFTLDLVQKDIGLFQKLAETHDVPLELSPLIIAIVADGQRRLGLRAQSDRLVERLEAATGLSILADGFPTDLIDDEPEEEGHEILRSPAAGFDALTLGAECSDTREAARSLRL